MVILQGVNGADLGGVGYSPLQILYGYKFTTQWGLEGPGTFRDQYRILWELPNSPSLNQTLTPSFTWLGKPRGRCRFLRIL